MKKVILDDSILDETLEYYEKLVVTGKDEEEE